MGNGVPARETAARPARPAHRHGRVRSHTVVVHLQVEIGQDHRACAAVRKSPRSKLRKRRGGAGDAGGDDRRGGGSSRQLRAAARTAGCAGLPHRLRRALPVRPASAACTRANRRMPCCQCPARSPSRLEHPLAASVLPGRFPRPAAGPSPCASLGGEAQQCAAARAASSPLLLPRSVRPAAASAASDRQPAGIACPRRADRAAAPSVSSRSRSPTTAMRGISRPPEPGPCPRSRRQVADERLGHRAHRAAAGQQQRQPRQAESRVRNIAAPAPPPAHRQSRDARRSNRLAGRRRSATRQQRLRCGRSPAGSPTSNHCAGEARCRKAAPPRSRGPTVCWWRTGLRAHRAAGGGKRSWMPV